MRLAWVLMIWIGLVGCSDTPQAMLDDYLDRVARALQVERVSQLTQAPIDEANSRTSGVDVLAALPSRKAFAVPEPEQSIDLLEFLSLSSCELGRTLGERNSSLGKLAPPSQRLHLQRDILLAAPECISGLQETDPTLAQRLTSMMTAKQDARMQYWWNGWFTSHEWQALLSLGAPLLPHSVSQSEVDPGASDAQLATLQAFDYLIAQGQRWAQGRLDYDSAEMEFHQQQWLASEAIGGWRATNDALRRMSLMATEQLHQRLGDRKLCPQGNKTPQAEIVQTVFHKFYAGQVQPYLSRSERFADALEQRLASVSELLVLVQADHPGVEKPDSDAAEHAWRTLRQQFSVERQAMQQAHLAHVGAWQQLLGQCGMMPSR